MSIFLDPSADRKVFPTAYQTSPLPRNTCGPDPEPCGTCAPLPHLATTDTCNISTPGCIILTPSGIQLPMSDNSACSPNQLQKQTADNQYINMLSNENLNLGGADACIFKMLGVQQQGTLIDAAGGGCPIASDSIQDHPAHNAYDRFATFFSTDTAGQQVLQSWLGYDFGLLTRVSGLPMYSDEANAESRKHITTIAIKQAGDVSNWVKRVRVERSDDGKRWQGVDVLTLPQTPERVQLSVKQSVPSRMWRIRPIETLSTGRWLVDTLELFEFVSTDLNNIQDSPLFQENRDRAYCVNPVKMKVYYDLVNISTELSRFGIDLPTATLTLRVNFSEAVKQLGRGIIIGDVIEIPSEMQFTSDMKIVRKYVEVSDVTWSTSGYTPGWTPLFQQVTAKPMLARQEVIDIIGSLEADIGGDGAGYGSESLIFSDFALKANEQIQIAADNMVPQLGEDEQLVADISEIPPDVRNAAAVLGVNLNKFVTNYAEPVGTSDTATQRTAMPPSGTRPEMFTVGDHSVGFPQTPVNGQYHRMSYESITAEKIPPKLYRYSLAKNRWIFLESDERYQIQTNKSRLKSYLVDEDRSNLNEIK